MKLFIFVWLISLVYGSPIRKKDGENVCIFAPGETLVEEESDPTKKVDRPDMSKVSGECSGELKP